MANMIDKMLDFLKLSYDEEYDAEEDDAYEEEARDLKKKKKEEERAELQRQREQKQREQKAKSKEQRVMSSVPGARSDKSSVRNVSVVGGGNSSMESEIVSIRPKDDKARQAIGDRLLEGKTVVINLDGLELEVAQRIVDFTFGVCYAIKGDMKFPSKYIVIAAPHEVELSGTYETSNEATQRAAKFPFEN